MLVLASVLHTGVKLGLPVAAGNAVNGLLGSHGPASGPWVPLAIALLAAEAVIQAAIAWSSTVSAAATTARTRHLMLRHAIAVGPRLTRVLPAADLVSRLTGNAALAGSTSVKVIGVLRTGLPAVAAAVIMYWIDLWCATVFTAGLLLLTFLLAGLMRTTAGINARYLDAQARIAATLAEVLGGVRTVAAAGTAPVERRRILTPVPELHANGQQLWQTQSVAAARVTALMPMLSILVAGIAGCRLTEGRLSVGAMFEVFGYASLGSELVGALAGAVALGQCRAARARCTQVLTEPATAYGPAQAPPGTGAVTFVDVWLGQGPEAVLRGVDVRILGGEHVAVVGRSGAGKSAFAALIGRLAEPDRGVVCLDGRPVGELERCGLARGHRVRLHPTRTAGGHGGRHDRAGRRPRGPGRCGTGRPRRPRGDVHRPGAERLRHRVGRGADVGRRGATVGSGPRVRPSRSGAGARRRHLQPGHRDGASGRAGPGLRDPTHPRRRRPPCLHGRACRPGAVARRRPDPRRR